MSELREMHLSELLTILAEVPGDRIDHFNNAIKMAKTLETDHAALLRERDNLRNFIENIIKNECWNRVEYLDGGDVQDEAERMGVLVQVPHATPCEDELCGCEGEDVDHMYNFAWRVSTLNTEKA
jgi:hypothetical protein